MQLSSPIYSLSEASTGCLLLLLHKHDRSMAAQKAFFLGLCLLMQ